MALVPDGNLVLPVQVHDGVGHGEHNDAIPDVVIQHEANLIPAHEIMLHNDELPLSRQVTDDNDDARFPMQASDT